MKSLYLICCMLLAGLAIQAQQPLTITAPGGAALPTRYCYTDSNYALAGMPAGGTFSGCGVIQLNGQWYFNPVAASSGVTVFPYQCTLVYTAGNQSTNLALLIWKPVVITPPLQDTGTCSGLFQLEANTLYAGAYEFRWTPAEGLDNPDLPVTEGTIAQTTTFILTARDYTSNCMGSDTVIVTRLPVPDVSATPADTLILSRRRIQLHAQGAERYYWLPPQWLDNDTIPAPVAAPQAPLTYTVVGMNEAGCIDSARVVIDVQEKILVPNAFSPNGDGINDVFGIENIGYQGISEFSIFNRWGQRIFQTIDGTKGWDGSYEGRPADMGTYYYLIRLALRDGSIRTYKGDLALIR